MGEDDLARTMFTRAGATTRRASAPPKTSRTYSGAHQDDRDPKPVDEVLQRWVRDHGVSAEVGTGSVIARWEEIVGADLADHVTADSVQQTPEGPELLLRAESTAWATQVRLLAPNILGRIRTLLGPGVVDRLKVVGPAPPKGPAGPRRVPGRGPRDTYG